LRTDALLGFVHYDSVTTLTTRCDLPLEGLLLASVGPHSASGRARVAVLGAEQPFMVREDPLFDVDRPGGAAGRPVAESEVPRGTGWLACGRDEGGFRHGSVQTTRSSTQASVHASGSSSQSGTSKRVGVLRLFTSS
jgi:hypothetical protein